MIEAAEIGCGRLTWCKASARDAASHPIVRGSRRGECQHVNRSLRAARALPNPKRLLSMISIEGLTVSYGHVEALRGIDLEVRHGEITAIIGSNGAGKTSTLMAICGLAPSPQVKSASRDKTSHGVRRTRSPGSALRTFSKAASCSLTRPSRTTCCSAAILACRAIAHALQR
jgi:ABC-type molybdenum transport system ATPase subunit/photorepair protein PhrA